MHSGSRPARQRPQQITRRAYPRPCTRAELAAGPAQDDGPGPPIIRAQLQQITRAHTYTHASRPGQKITGPGTTAAAPQAIPPAPAAGQPTTGPAATHSSHPTNYTKRPRFNTNAPAPTTQRPRAREILNAPARRYWRARARPLRVQRRKIFLGTGSKNRFPGLGWKNRKEGQNATKMPRNCTAGSPRQEKGGIIFERTLILRQYAI